MNQAQAIVTAVIRILGGIGLLLMIGTFFYHPSLEFTPSDLAQLSAEPDAGIKAIDFAGGTVVHINSFGYIAVAFCFLLIVLSKKIAIWITPEIKGP